MSEESKPLRSVRSFVKRKGRMTRAQQRALDTLWPRYGIDDGGVLDLDALFGRSAPRVLEIGFGSGESLVAQAAAHPELDFLGIEVHEPGIGHCLLHAERAGLGNLRLVQGDAVDVMTRRLADGSVARIDLYFPDPWPKKRHHKRRLVQPGFLGLCARRLRAGGDLFIATDWASYAEHIDRVIAQSHNFALVERRTHAGERPLGRPTTRFERRGLQLGHEIRDWHLKKI